MRNRTTKGAVRTACKKFEVALAAGDKEKATEALALSFKLLDSAATKGIIHHNTADRKKSRLHANYNKLMGIGGKKEAPAPEAPVAK
jgi:small subunit ribosomal protein S20